MSPARPRSGPVGRHGRRTPISGRYALGQLLAVVVVLLVALPLLPLVLLTIVVVRLRDRAARRAPETAPAPPQAPARIAP